MLLGVATGELENGDKVKGEEDNGVPGWPLGYVHWVSYVSHGLNAA